ncbi:MAG: hypothetical protein AB1768_14580 [Pseudomonadota bacterium]
MSKQIKIPDTEEAWESGDLGRDEAHVQRYEGNDERQINESLGLQPISIRLEKELLNDLKFIAQYHGMGYQPLIRQQLKRFVNAEMKQIAMALASEAKKNREAKKTAKAGPDDPPKQKKAA